METNKASSNAGYIFSTNLTRKINRSVKINIPLRIKQILLMIFRKSCHTYAHQYSINANAKSKYTVYKKRWSFQ
jgi:hypothetical protein